MSDQKIILASDDIKVSPTTLSGPIDKVQLSSDQIREILITAGTKTLASHVPVLGKVLEMVDTINNEIREEKLSVLLQNFATKFDSIDDVINRLGIIFRDRAGLIIFQKVVQILDGGESDEEWIVLLSSTLKKMTDSDIRQDFEEKMFCLSQIDRLSPQALIILSQWVVWESVKIGGTTTTSGMTTSGDWSDQVSTYFSRSLNIGNGRVGGRISHAFQELHSVGIIRLEGERLLRTQIGDELYKYIHIE